MLSAWSRDSRASIRTTPSEVSTAVAETKSVPTTVTLSKTRVGSGSGADGGSQPSVIASISARSTGSSPASRAARSA